MYSTSYKISHNSGNRKTIQVFQIHWSSHHLCLLVCLSAYMYFCLSYTSVRLQCTLDGFRVFEIDKGYLIAQFLGNTIQESICATIYIIDRNNMSTDRIHEDQGGGGSGSRRKCNAYQDTSESMRSVANACTVAKGPLFSSPYLACSRIATAVSN